MSNSLFQCLIDWDWVWKPTLLTPHQSLCRTALTLAGHPKHHRLEHTTSYDGNITHQQQAAAPSPTPLQAQRVSATRVVPRNLLHKVFPRCVTTFASAWFRFLVYFWFCFVFDDGIECVCSTPFIRHSVFCCVRFFCNLWGSTSASNSLPIKTLFG